MWIEVGTKPGRSNQQIHMEDESKDTLDLTITS